MGLGRRNVYTQGGRHRRQWECRGRGQGARAEVSDRRDGAARVIRDPPGPWQHRPELILAGRRPSAEQTHSASISGDLPADAAPMPKPMPMPPRLRACPGAWELRDLSEPWCSWVQARDEAARSRAAESCGAGRQRQRQRQGVSECVGSVSLDFGNCRRSAQSSIKRYEAASDAVAKLPPHPSPTPPAAYACIRLLALAVRDLRERPRLRPPAYRVPAVAACVRAYARWCMAQRNRVWLLAGDGSANPASPATGGRAGPGAPSPG